MLSSRYQQQRCLAHQDFGYLVSSLPKITLTNQIKTKKVKISKIKPIVLVPLRVL